MPFKYGRDDSHNRIVITFYGAFRMREALASIERRRVENTWSQAVLYDIRHMVGQPDIKELLQLLKEDLAVAPEGLSRGPLAVVAAASSLYIKA